MPKAKRTLQEIEEVKGRILQCALELISEEGYANFSMRRIAKRTKMTAANIYNYFLNKDKLYIELVMNGFNLLFEKINDAVNAHNDELNKVKALIKAYIEFGTQNAQYFDIMFNRAVPKYLDYVGTEYEEFAHFEKQSSNRSLYLATEIMREFRASRSGLKRKDGVFLSLELWCQVHGLISLYNSGILSETFKNPKEIIDKMEERIFLSLTKEDNY